MRKWMFQHSNIVTDQQIDIRKDEKARFRTRFSIQLWSQCNGISIAMTTVMLYYFTTRIWCMQMKIRKLNKKVIRKWQQRCFMLEGEQVLGLSPYQIVLESLRLLLYRFSDNYVQVVWKVQDSFSNTHKISKKYINISRAD